MKRNVIRSLKILIRSHNLEAVNLVQKKLFLIGWLTVFKLLDLMIDYWRMMVVYSCTLSLFRKKVGIHRRVRKKKL